MNWPYSPALPQRPKFKSHFPAKLDYFGGFIKYLNFIKLVLFKNEIRKAEEEIRETKEELVKARKIRRNRMEYDAMAKVINKNPDRDTQGIKIEEIKSEIEQLKVTEAALEDKLESRKKQFHVLVQSIHNLQALLDEDNEINLTDKESIDESQIDDDIIVMDVS